MFHHFFKWRSTFDLRIFPIRLLPTGPGSKGAKGFSQQRARAQLQGRSLALGGRLGGELWGCFWHQRSLEEAEWLEKSPFYFFSLPRKVSQKYSQKRNKKKERLQHLPHYLNTPLPPNNNSQPDDLRHSPARSGGGHRRGEKLFLSQLRGGLPRELHTGGQVLISTICGAFGRLL